MLNEFRSVIEMLDYCKDQNTCIQYLEEHLFTQRGYRGLHRTCPHCGRNIIAYTHSKGYQCSHKSCGKKFNVLTNTIFENTKLPLRTWFYAIYIITAHKTGINSHQLAKDLKVTQKTAWFLLHRIREMLKSGSDLFGEPMTGIVEVDETFVGGKNKNRHKNKKVEKSQGRSFKDKKAVVGLVQRSVVEYTERPHKRIPGKMVKEKIVKQPSMVRMQVVEDTEATTLHNLIYSNVHQDTKLVTDAYRSYNGLEEVYDHTMVKHGLTNYKTEGDNHTNTVEGSWTTLKRMYYGIYRYMSPKHLQRYCDEMSFRYNTNQVVDYKRFDLAIRMTKRARIRYTDLIGSGRKVA